MRPLEEEVRGARCWRTPLRGAALTRALPARVPRRPGLGGQQELKNVFEKLHKYVGRSVEALVNRPDAPHVFRLHKKVRRCARARARRGGKGRGLRRQPRAARC
jgi:hypothetical protein